MKTKGKWLGGILNGTGEDSRTWTAGKNWRTWPSGPPILAKDPTKTALIAQCKKEGIIK